MADQVENSVFERDWAAYYRAVEGRPPRETLLTALAKFDTELAVGASRFAVDLGCGDGRDSVELLRRGWWVVAIDGEQEAISRLRDRPQVDHSRLETVVMRFEHLALPESVDLVNASFCLAFCPPAAFPGMWQTVTAALRPGGRFSGQLFGEHDSWAIHPNVSCFTRQQVEEFLQAYDVEWLQEEDHPGKTAIGEEKYWHIFHIVARKR